MLVVLLACLLAAAPANAADILKTESIGPLKVGTTEKQLYAKFGRPTSVSLEYMSEATALYVQQWFYPDMELWVSSEAKGGPKKIDSITVLGKSKLATAKGIRIGSTRVQVLKAYKKLINLRESDSDTLVVGSVYGGLIIAFKKDRVVKLFLGAAAE
jgi:hypothetical protein